MVINVDFVRRQIVSQPLVKVANGYSGTDPVLAHWYHMVESLNARYGDRPIRGGVIYRQPLTKNTRMFDSYGRGNCHNSKYQYKPKNKLYWNNPIPLPCNLPEVINYLKAHTNKHLTLGCKSDPFMWMDSKYQMTKIILEQCNQLNITLTINTMSDLCAHNDYIELLAGHTVIMNMGSNDDKQERRDSPGAPSVLRRNRAIEKLEQAGIAVKRYFPLTGETI